MGKAAQSGGHGVQGCDEGVSIVSQDALPSRDQRAGRRPTLSWSSTVALASSVSASSDPR